MFLIFWNFRGSFFSLIFGFWKFWNCILNHKSHFWGGLFYKTFWFEASLYMFLIFGTLGGLFWVWCLVFENFEIVFWIRNPTFGGLFYKTFWFGALFLCFDFFGILGGLFIVWFLVFENFEIAFWIRIPTYGGVCFMKLFDLRLLRWFYPYNWNDFFSSIFGHQGDIRPLVNDPIM